MQLNDILDMWDDDASIDNNHLDTSSIITAKLHSKYLKILLDFKLKLIKYNSDYDRLKKLKFSYYRGELTKQELEDLGWEQYLFNKPIRTEMDNILSGDADIIKIRDRIKYIDTLIFAVESIMSQIKQRDWQIKNSIEFKKFLAGG